MAPEVPPPSPLERRGFAAAIAACLLASLIAIWWPRFPPMQDYPHHLFIAHVLASYDRPDLNWRDVYEVDLELGPYSTFYALARVLAGGAGIEAAGKLVLSLYPILVAAVAWRAWRQLWPDRVPWALLPIFPLAFDATFYLGFVNYLLSVPVLLLALLELDRAAARPPDLPGVARLAACLALLLLAHPASVAVFCALAGVRVALVARDRASLLRGAWPPISVGAALALWMAAHAALSSPQDQLQFGPSSFPPAVLAGYLALPFAGFDARGGPRLFPFAAWLAAALLIALGALGRGRPALPWRYGAYLICALAGYWLLPFWFSEYSYFNLRLTTLIYLLLALLLGGLRVAPAFGVGIAASALLLLAHTVQLNRRLSDEIAEIVPIARAMPPNSDIRRVLYDARSRRLDPRYFPDFHAHDIFYYHILVGGGANPYLLPNRMLPLRFRPAYAAYQGYHALLHEVGMLGRHDFLLVRGLPPGLRTPDHDLVLRSGSWTLLRPRAG